MKRGEATFLIGLSALGLSLRLFRIGYQSLWVDEMLTILVSTSKPDISIWGYLKYNIHGPLHSFVVWLFTLVGSGDGWLRIPSALAGAATIYFLYRWAAPWLGVPVARAAALLLALHPLHMYYSQEVRGYAFLLMFTTLASMYLHRLLADESRRNGVGYVLSMAAAPLCNFSAAFIYGVHTVLYFCRRGFTARRLWMWVVVSLAILVLISPWVYRIYRIIDVKALVTPVMPGELETTERLRGETTITPEALPYTFYVFSVGFSLGPPLRALHEVDGVATVVARWWPALVWVGLLFGGLFVRGIVSLSRRRGALFGILLYLLVPLIVTLLLNWQNAKAFNPRYVLTSLPAFLCVIGAGIVSLPRLFARVAGAAVLATLLLSLANYYFDGDYAREDVRGAARFLAQSADAGACILAPGTTEVFEYYYDGPSPVYSIFAPIGTPRERFDEQLGRVLAACGEIWYVRSRPWSYDPHDRALAALDEERTRSEVVEFDGVTVYRFVR